MRIIVFVVAILASMCIAKGVTHPGNKHLKRVTRQPCDPKWSKLYANHTMCLNDVGTEVVLDAATKTQIVERHNQIRSDYARYGTTMLKMIWDDQLALVASKWARQCSKERDTVEMRAVPSLPGYKIGQNLAVGPKDFIGAINAWEEEKKDHTWRSTAPEVENYAQMVLFHTLRIGCGQAKCQGTFSDVYVCNYDRSIKFVDWLRIRFGCREGCLGMCDNKRNLCICEPTVCLNGGYELCGYCKCPLKYTGDNCESLRDDCLRPDPDFCVRADPECWDILCPHKCGICSGKNGLIVRY